MSTIRCFFCDQELTITDVRCTNHACQRQQILHSRFRILRILGQGGHGKVYEVLDELLDVKRAIKCISAVSIAAQDQIQGEFRLLARHARKLHFMPEIYDVWSENTDTYLVMEYIDGQTIRESVAMRGKWSSADVERFLRQILDHLSDMERARLVHRDLKPDNIKQRPDGTYILIDFGIATQNGAATTREAYSRYYASPEQVTAQLTDIRSDLYSLGATAYSLLTGSTPEDSADRLHYGAPIYAFSSFDLEVPETLESLIMSMLELDPANRPQTPEDALDTLDETPGRHPRITPRNITQLTELFSLSCTLNLSTESYHTLYGGRLSLSPDSKHLLITAGANAELWDITKMAPAILPQSTNAIAKHSWSWTGKYLAIARDDNSLLVVLLSDTTRCWQKSFSTSIQHLSWSPDDHALAIELTDHRVFLLDVEGTERWIKLPYRTTESDAFGDLRLSWSHDSQRLALLTGAATIVFTSSLGRKLLSIDAAMELRGIRWSTSSPSQLFAVLIGGGSYCWDTSGELLEVNDRPDIKGGRAEQCVLFVLLGGDPRVQTRQGQLEILDDSPPFLRIGVEGQEAQYTIPISDSPRSYVWDEDHTTLVLSFPSGDVRIWQQSTTTSIESWSPDGQTILVSTKALDRQWKQKTLLRADGTLIAPLFGSREPFWSGWSPDSQQIAYYSEAWSGHGTAHICRIDGTMTSITIFDVILSATWSRDSRHLIVEDVSRIVELFTTSGTCVGTTGRNSVHSIYPCSRDGKLLAQVRSRDNCAELVRLDGSFRIFLPGVLDEDVCNAHEGIAWSEQRRLVAVGLANGELKLWTETGQLWHALVDHHETVCGVLFSPDGNVLETRSVRDVVHVWHLEATPRRIFELVGYRHRWSPAWQHLAIVSERGDTHIYSRNGILYATIPAGSDTNPDLQWSPNERMLAVRDGDGTATIWKTSGARVCTIGSTSAPLTSIIWSPHGRIIAGHQVDGETALWDLSGRPLTHLPGHLSWSSDGRLIGLEANDICRIMGIPAQGS